MGQWQQAHRQGKGQRQKNDPQGPFWMTTRMVGKRGFEPPAPASRTLCSTGLSHFPTFAKLSGAYHASPNIGQSFNTPRQACPPLFPPAPCPPKTKATAGAPGRCLYLPDRANSVDCVGQLAAWFEFGDGFRRDGDLFAGPRIFGCTFRAFDRRKGAEANQRHLVALGKGLGNSHQHAIQCLFGIQIGRAHV